MKGLILAGGFATRLRPLSCSKPKLLFPIVGVPLIDRMQGWLEDGGVREVILAVNHLLERLKAGVGQERLGSKIIFSVEREPLGTAGPLRLASKLLGQDRSFVVINGDIVSDIDLKAMVKQHEKHQATATVALVSVKDSRQYGSVSVDRDARVSRFEEKRVGRGQPGWVNAGAYVFSQDVFDFIPDEGPASLEREVFPRLAAKGRVWGWKHYGYWYDIGRIPEYVKANMQLLAKAKMDGRVKKAVHNIKAMKPVHVGKGSSLGSGVSLGPNCVLSDRVVVGDRASVRHSIVFEDCIIGEDCELDGALIGEKVVVGAKSRIRQGAVVAGQISIPDGSIVKSRSIILA